jgi:hypothetical protein
LVGQTVLRIETEALGVRAEAGTSTPGRISTDDRHPTTQAAMPRSIDADSEDIEAPVG